MHTKPLSVPEISLLPKIKEPEIDFGLSSYRASVAQSEGVKQSLTGSHVPLDALLADVNVSLI